MTSQKSSSVFADTKQDFKISWYLLKANWRAFVATELFALISLILMLFVSLIIFGVFFYFTRRMEAPTFIRSSFTLNFIVTILIVLLFNTFLTSQFGLAYDIISSGDMFTEFRSSFTYFRRHWLYYSLFTFLIGWVQLLFEPRTILPLLRVVFLIPIFGGNTGDVGGNRDFMLEINLVLFLTRNIVIFLIHFISFLIFVNAIPSITAQGKFKQSLRDNFRILRKAPRQLITTWGIFFLVFSFVPLLINFLSVLSFTMISGSIPAILLNLLSTTIFLIGILLGAPFMALIATRMYNRIELNIQPTNIIEKSKKSEPNHNENEESQ